MLSHGLLPDTELLEKMFPTTLDMKNPYKVQKKKKKKKIKNLKKKKKKKKFKRAQQIE